ncbi:MAG: hypothetical protein IJP11_04135 [Oscillospiraceae bacterium]|nr:hypothetical protein [Oscillospiraceae bacterium]
MKRMISLVLLIIVFVLLSACDPGSFSIDKESLNNVVNIELVQYANPNQKHFSSWVPDQFDKLMPFVPANATVLESLPSEKTTEFLDSFSNTDILHTYYAYNSPKDVCIRLNYENGNFLIIWANYAETSYAGYIGEYTSDGTVLSFWGSFSSLNYYTDLVNQYFNYSLK